MTGLPCHLQQQLTSTIQLIMQTAFELCENNNNRSSRSSPEQVVCDARTAAQEAISTCAAFWNERVRILQLPAELERITLSGVCRLWRTTLRSNSRLWNALAWLPGPNEEESRRVVSAAEDRDLSLFSELLDLSVDQQRDISLRFRGLNSLQLLPRYISKISEPNKRISSLRMTFEDLPVESQMFSHFTTLPELEKLDISRDYAHVKEDLPLDANVFAGFLQSNPFPSLRRLTLSSFYFDEISHSLDMLHGLKEVKIIVIASTAWTMRNTLSACPSITDLAVDSVTVLTDGQPDPEIEDVLPQSLQRFTWSVRSVDIANEEHQFFPSWFPLMLRRVPEIILIFTSRWNAYPTYMFDDLDHPTELSLIERADDAWSGDSDTPQPLLSVRVVDQRGFVRDVRFEQEPMGSDRDGNITPLTWDLKLLTPSLSMDSITTIRSEYTIWADVMRAAFKFPSLVALELYFAREEQHGLLPKYDHTRGAYPELRTVKLSASGTSKIPLDQSLVLHMLQTLLKGMSRKKLSLVAFVWPVIYEDVRSVDLMRDLADEIIEV
ncbi:hypothetical protein BKA62DRAFT_703042 [Auriculariales sp. MPI-PUGE-AT-0066]|nr:hypothetical protein BKA62DRAFT_703042 [Auriculariales sp. MPI-PUGE-AT-0066]